MIEPYYTGTFVTLYLGDCIALMDVMPEASIDAIVTDPPYGLQFMGKEWDRLDSQWPVAALRVLKPGAHLLTFGGTRTHHRLMCAFEDAGFEIRDCLMWLYGSGFPKSLDVSKAIDKAAGATREIIGTAHCGGTGHSYNGPEAGRTRDFLKGDFARTAPATAAARAWQGWGTALKPAWEPIILARKPLAEQNVAANVLAHGTGAINVDGGRIGGAWENRSTGLGAGYDAQNTPDRKYGNGLGSAAHALGRWPANLVLDEDAARLLDEQSGELTSGGVPPRRNPDHLRVAYRAFRGHTPEIGIGSSSGGASRFFYTAKASAADRDGATHPTVKPTDLMAWLVKLVTPPGGVVLDPFAGSGTTLLAARSLGVTSIGIERDEPYLCMARHRLRQEVLPL